MPRWVRAFVIAGAILVVVFLVALVVGGNHGPGRHGAAGPVVHGVATDEPGDHEG